MNRTLYLLAEDFSNDSKECFFEKELPYHCAAFDRVYVLSLYYENLHFTCCTANIIPDSLNKTP